MTCTTTKTAAAILTAIAVTCTATACVNEPSEPAPPTITTETPPLSGVAQAGRSPGQQATEGAIAAVEGMFRTELEVGEDRAKDLNLLAQYLDDPYLKAMRDDITLRRSKGIVSQGEIEVISAHPNEVAAPQDDKGNPVKGDAEVLLKTCVDVSGYHSIDPEGNDTVDPNRINPAQAVFRVVNKDWPSDSGWRVVENTLPTVEACDDY